MHVNKDAFIHLLVSVDLWFVPTGILFPLDNHSRTTVSRRMNRFSDHMLLPLVKEMITEVERRLTAEGFLFQDLRKVKGKENERQTILVGFLAVEGVTRLSLENLQ